MSAAPDVRCARCGTPLPPLGASTASPGDRDGWTCPACAGEAPAVDWHAVVRDVHRRSVASILRTVVLWGVAGLAVAVLASLARAQAPEAVAASTADVGPAVEHLRLPAGRRAPFAGRLVVDEAWDRLRADLAVCEAVGPRLEAEVARVRAERDAAHADCQDRIADLASHVGALRARLAAVQPVGLPPRRPPSRVVWGALGGGGAILGAGAAYLLTDRSGGTLQGVGTLLGAVAGVGVVELVGWVLE